jgi:hypothetical protein
MYGMVKRNPPINRWAQIHVDRPDFSLHTTNQLEGAVGGLVDGALSPIVKFDVDRCPICLAPNDLTDEHVPPEQAGGTVITQTCRVCNSTLGSLVDVDLVDMLSDTVTSWWWSQGSGLPGRRNLGRTLLRGTQDGKFAWLLSGGDQLRRELAQMLAGGKVTVEIRPTDLRRARISGLKNAYLAACAQLQQIPDTPSAHQVRGELLAVRQ